MLQAADARHAAQLAPVLQQLKEMETGGAIIPEQYYNTVEVRDNMINQHKDFKAGLEQAFMSASSQPHTGSYSIRPFQDPYGEALTTESLAKTCQHLKLNQRLVNFVKLGLLLTMGALAHQPSR